MRGASAAGGLTSNARREDMVWIPGGSFLMGSNAFYREERPARSESVDGFWIDRDAGDQCGIFPLRRSDRLRHLSPSACPTPEMYPDAAPEFLVPGSLVFVKPPRPVSLRDHRAWWAYVPGANWRHPERAEQLDRCTGTIIPSCTSPMRMRRPMRPGPARQLPDETEWEFAARGGLEGAAYPWGDAANPEGRYMANTWQGRFPFENLAEDGFEGTSPVDAFPPNGFGLHDMVGNVWEWTSSLYSPQGGADKSCCQRDDADPQSQPRW